MTQVMTPEQHKAIRTTRALIDLGHSLDAVLGNPLIPPDLRDFVRNELARDDSFALTPVRTLTAEPDRPDWLRTRDRSSWHYWPTLRQHLLAVKGWTLPSVRSLDDASDSVLRQLAPPDQAQFDMRGLVLGYVQSGKTANYTALIAKAADAGYRLIVVLSGIDNGLRLQTNQRLKRELVGYSDGRRTSVPLPPMGLRWHEFTRDDLHGDFRPGYASHGALQGTQPVLLIVKKNGAVLRRLQHWLESSPQDVRRRIPLLMIDDEADLASVDTRGSYQTDDDAPDPDFEEPSVINGLIRGLLNQFDRRVYVAYTATPFANILIPHDTQSPGVGSDLYPKNFIVDLPKPSAYLGAEAFFGYTDPTTGDVGDGLDVIRHVMDEDLATLEHGDAPRSLIDAILDFVLAGAARAQRGHSAAPATMLVHTSQLILIQAHVRQMIATKFAELRDEWRYQRNHALRGRFHERWEEQFRPVTRRLDASRDVPFAAIETLIGPFLEAVQVREINSATGEALDYEREPSLKVIAVGGNRLSRGLTLEGLTVSYFVRRSATYDTLMQMGRWFGYRLGYEDLTRIYTTPELESWFRDLAFVEHRLREDIQIYEDQGLTPYQVGMRIWQHPTMQVTGPLKRRFASTTTIAQSYALSLEQTFKFPLRRLEDLAAQAEANLQSTRDLLRSLGSPDEAYSRGSSRPTWRGVHPDTVLEFLRHYRIDDEARSVSLPLVCAYIERLCESGELTEWTVGVCGRDSRDGDLGAVDWQAASGPINQISRSRLGDTDSVGVITSPGDEAVGLTDEDRDRAADLVRAAEQQNRKLSINNAARQLRPPTNGLLLLYPISRYSGHDLDGGGARQRLFLDPAGPLARDLVGLAISFPRSAAPQSVEAYLQGTVGWRPVE